MAIKYRKYKIEKDYKYVYNFLKEKSYSENFITNLRKNMNNIKINGITATTRTPLFVNDILEINANPNTKTTIMHCIIPLDIVYEDEYYLIVNKPSNLACMPTRSHYSNNLAGAICNYMRDKDDNFTLRIINRLDKDTAGLIIVAKDSIAEQEIKDIDKTYYALVCGLLEKPILIDKKIETISNNGKNVNKRIISDKGKEAQTFVTPIETLKNNNTLVKIKLIHGRTHQIRVHMSSVGHPLLGDNLYGGSKTNCNHTMLICKEISFFHPYLNKHIELSVPFSDDFKVLLEEPLQ